MKKQILTLVIALIPTVTFAKVSDFDSMINDNAKAQRELHSNLKGNLQDARSEAQLPKDRQRIVVVEKSGVSYNAPTDQSLLAFKKERRTHRASEDKQFERLAAEINSME